MLCFLHDTYDGVGSSGSAKICHSTATIGKVSILGRATSLTPAQFRLSPFSSGPSQSQRDKADLKMDLGGLELKLKSVTR